MASGSEQFAGPVAPWVLLAVFLLTLAAYTGVDLYLDYDRIRTAEEERLTRRTEIINVNLSLRLQATADALQSIGDEILDSVDLGAASKKNNERLHRYVAVMTAVRAILIVDGNGDVVASNQPKLIGMNFYQSDRYRIIREGGDPATIYLPPPFLTPLNEFALSVGKVMLDSDGRFKGYVLAILDPDYFGILLKSLIYAPDMRLGVVHADGKIVYRVPDNENIIGVDLSGDPDSVFVRHVRSGQPASFHEAASLGFRDIRLISFRTVQPSTSVADKSLFVFASRDRAAVFGPWVKELVYRAVLIAIIFVVAVLWVLSQQRRQRAQALYRARRLAERDRADAEIRQLNADLERRVVQRTAELSEANLRLEHLSRRDELTGLANRRALDVQLRKEHIRFRRLGHPYAVLMIDIDHFKQFNDRHGHAAGDEVLRNVARALAGTVRETDFVARFGGEEFFALLPETGLQSAEQVAEKMRGAIESLPDTGCGRITVSIGVAPVLAGDADENIAVQAADAMLYAAKKAGRNCVRLAPPRN